MECSMDSAFPWNIIASLRSRCENLPQAARGHREGSCQREVFNACHLSSAIFLPLYFSAQCAAARRATGTRNGEQET